MHVAVTLNVHTVYFILWPVEDGDAIDSCILATLRKLQDGYFAGARSVSFCNTRLQFITVNRLFFTQVCCNRRVYVCANVTTGCRCQTSPHSRPLRSTLISRSWMKKTTTACLRMTRMNMASTERNITTVGPQVVINEWSVWVPFSHNKVEL